MSAGGYIYAQTDLAYDANTNGLTVRSWALAVHKARCDAFLKAASREAQGFGGNGWYGVNTGLYDELSDTASSGDTYYIQDIHPTSIDTAEGYPAFVSFFMRNGTTNTYCIITTRNYHSNPNYSDINSYYTYGLYLNWNNIITEIGPQFGGSLGHAYAHNGFGSYDVADSNMIYSQCTKLMAAYSVKRWNGQNYTDNYESGSLVYRRAGSQTWLNNKTYSFGYAIKGDQIETFMRETSWDNWQWSIIGNIIGSTIDPNDTSKICGVISPRSSGSETSSTFNGYDMLGSASSCSASFTTTSGNVFTAQASAVILGISSSPDGCSSVRISTVTPNETRYNSVFVGAFQSAYYVNSDPGVDGNGNGGKGFLSTDIIRMVSKNCCQTSGATYQDGNFVVPTRCRTDSGSDHGIGYILGWDASNPSII